MGLLRSARDRFLPPSNRVYVSRSDTALSDLAALRQEVGQLKGAVVQLKGMVEQLAKGVGDVKGTQGAITSSIKQLSAAQEGRQKELLSILDCLMLTMSRRSLGRKTILLAGWYCAGNLGDELMLRTLVSYAPVSIRDDIYVLAWNDNPAFDPESLNDLGVHTIRYPCTTREVDMLASCFDVLVWGGRRHSR